MIDPKRGGRISTVAASVLIAGALTVCVAIPASAATETAGRLFFTPTEREVLDRARTRPFTCLSVTGVIVRHGERYVYWANENFDDPRTSTTVVAVNDSRTAFEIHLGPERAIMMRTGQSLDMVDGSIREAFEVVRERCGGNARQ